jgi:hypothetical protein
VVRNKTKPEILRIAAERAASEPAFFAHALREYCAMFGLDLRSLATKLGCNIHDMTRLALCRKPDFNTPKWNEALEQIAHFVHVDSQLLLQLLREVDTLTAMRAVRSSTPLSGKRVYRPSTAAVCFDSPNAGSGRLPCRRSSRGLTVNLVR